MRGKGREEDVPGIVGVALIGPDDGAALGVEGDDRVAQTRRRVIVVIAGGDEDAKKAAVQLIVWGVIFIFVMVSVWGLVGILVGSFDFDTTIPATPNVPPLN